MVMKDKLVKYGKKKSPIFNLRNLFLSFFGMVIVAALFIPTYLTISHIEARATDETTSELVESEIGDNSEEEILNIITYN